MHDQKILELSINEERIIITMDKDFGELVYNAGFAMHGILLLRLENMTGLEKGKIVMHILDNFSDKLEGNFCVYHKGRFRVRHKKL
jgi:predicted nuclease of predicted toxin-antitoxin system